eukprot:TRINITY_DN111187_c0_g1_i1.p1 TRINITY_DN111187_c0_g1~~TRINITY_DN111187_c0_g1_i1.p1  ORF type:complete len:218 (+),score=28.36 TRINITY_DN111187_c0_g1_i1:76-654(+)
MARQTRLRLLTGSGLLALLTGLLRLTCRHGAADLAIVAASTGDEDMGNFSALTARAGGAVQLASASGKACPKAMPQAASETEEDAAAAQRAVEAFISGNPVAIFSLSRCPFCADAKQALEEMGVSYAALELDEMGEEGAHIKAALGRLTQRTSLPNIFIGGMGIGGCNDGPGLLTLKKSGELERLLQMAGAL